jgi:H(+)-transporting ATP synthase subunit D
MKSKLKGAQVGHDLLKRKSEALTKRFRDITKRIDEAKRKMGRVMQIAAFSLAEVTYAVGNNTIGYQITESVRQAKFRVRTKQENVSGVFLPQFESFQMEGGSDFQMTGLGKGGQQVAKCRETYTRAVETLVELASLQTAFVILDEVIKVVNRRVNAMYVFIAILPASRTTTDNRTTVSTSSSPAQKTPSSTSTANSTRWIVKSSSDSRRSRVLRRRLRLPRRLREGRRFNKKRKATRRMRARNLHRRKKRRRTFLATRAMRT